MASSVGRHVFFFNPASVASRLHAPINDSILRGAESVLHGRAAWTKNDTVLCLSVCGKRSRANRVRLPESQIWPS